VEALRNKKLHTVGEHEIKDSLLKSDFDYIALGHYHCQAQISSNAWYSGSIEYFNFGESEDKKGILLVDLERNETQCVNIRPRYMINHPPIDCIGLSSLEIKEKLIEICDRDIFQNRIVRVNLKNVNRAAYKNIDQATLNRLKAAALHLDIKAEFQDEQKRKTEPIDRFSLQIEFAKFLEEEGVRKIIPQAIKDEVVTYGTSLLNEAVVLENSEALDAP
jgi:exonuclease SbcD